ncbi:hypothetical protein B0J15DRAFT_468322 [Fusarium solani]|uniref:Protein kinase domain-containing protein n=1 Tax=Fusarium solani TaxID=169388 RepID=A0A9P9GZB1_FUSSL|nr:uncharacterized protein B0J15DRAFT_468322 [Fusarium solani]KAH7248313.1 hypothetical protein B0J15DRAFT_468322 [Fusarium solani]
MSKRLTQLDFSSILPSPVTAATNRTPRDTSSASAVSTPRLSPILEVDNGGVPPPDLPIYVHEPLNDRYPEAYTVHMGSNKVKVVSVKRNDARGDRDGGFLREFRGSGAIDDVKAVQRISNSSFLEVLETWGTNESFYVVFKFMPLCLVDVSAASSLSENEIPVIFNQVLDGLSYLVKEGLTHDRLICSNVLINYEGEVKICRKFRLLILEFLNVYDEQKNTTQDVAQNPFWSAMPQLMDFVEYTEITVKQVLKRQLPDASCLKMLSE